MRPPNVVVITADDMRFDDLRWMPATRRLVARQGVSFANSFSSLPLCAPSRASFLTGQYPHNHGVLGNHRRWGFHAFDDSSTLATDLHRAGYRTGLVGKYINGYGEEAPPRVGGDPQSRHYVPPGWSMWLGAPTVADGPHRGAVYNYRRTTISRNGELESLRGRYNTRAFGALSARLIHRWGGSATPFFLYESYVAPHFGRPAEPDDPPIWQSHMPRIEIRTPAVTGAVRGRFDAVITHIRGNGEPDASDKPGWVREMPRLSARARAAIVESERQRAEALAELDEQVARTIRALRRAHELRRTVVIFTSDNGWFEGEHRLEADKTIPYDAAFRVPLLIRGPGLPKGAVRTAPVVNVDLAPTIDELAGAVADRVVDGRSILRLARRGELGPDQNVLTEVGPFGSLDLWVKDALQMSGINFHHSSRFLVGVRTRRFTYLRLATGEVELYDMRRDPGELDNVAGDAAYASEQTDMDALLQRLEDCAGRNCR